MDLSLCVDCPAIVRAGIVNKHLRETERWRKVELCRLLQVAEQTIFPPAAGTIVSHKLRESY